MSSVEKPKQNWSPSEQPIEPTIIISEKPDADQVSAEDILAALPLKPQERYKFIRSIGFGGMKGVLLVHDRDTCRDIAMAIMPDFRERPQADLCRFVREAQITAKLEHPNIVSVHDIGIDSSGSPFFTMTYLRGSTLAVILRKLQKKDESVAKYNRLRLLQILMRVCNAVGFAHSQGICHLDLKPGNVHVGDFGDVQVIDWGLAAATDADFSAGSIKGTPGYIAPEVITSSGTRRPDKAADIYALGAILYSILTLDSPFAHLPQQEALQRAGRGEVIPPCQIDPQIPSALEAICLKAMALNPADRYQSAKEMRNEITAALSDFPTRAENPSMLRRAVLFIRRHLPTLIIGFLTLMVLALAYLVWTYRNILNM